MKKRATKLFQTPQKCKCWNDMLVVELQRTVDTRWTKTPPASPPAPSRLSQQHIELSCHAVTNQSINIPSKWLKGASDANTRPRTLPNLLLPFRLLPWMGRQQENRLIAPTLSLRLLCVFPLYIKFASFKERPRCLRVVCAAQAAAAPQ